MSQIHDCIFLQYASQRHGAIEHCLISMYITVNSHDFEFSGMLEAKVMKPTLWGGN